MICISEFCPRYAECGRAVKQTDHLEQYINLGSYASGIISGDGSKVSWWCGAEGNYAFFIPKDKMDI